MMTAGEVIADYAAGAATSRANRVRRVFDCAVFRNHSPSRRTFSPTAAGLVNLLSGLPRARLVCHTRRMNTPPINRYQHHRFPVEIISHAVWLCCRFCRWKSA
jgi:hypothetical protein